MPNPLTYEAVMAAVAEHDALGEDRFLAKYKAGKALEYVLEIDGERYASKAIVRAGLMAVNDGVRQRKTGGVTGAVRDLRKLGFTVIRLPRDPDAPPTTDVKWAWDEHVLALELYQESYPKLPSDRSVEVIELSGLLNRLGALKGIERTEKYRNADGVGMKLANFRRHDPRYTRQTRKGEDGKEVLKVGLSQGAKGEKEVWDRYQDDPQGLAAAASAVRAFINQGERQPTLVAIEPDEYRGKPEGEIRFRLHKIRERSPALVKDKLAQVMRGKGRLECDVCSFDFSKAFGTHGQGFLEVHHTVPIALSEPGRVTTLDELAVVCANCHRMLHRNDLIAVDDLRAIFQRHGYALAFRD